MRISTFKKKEFFLNIHKIRRGKEAMNQENNHFYGNLEAILVIIS